MALLEGFTTLEVSIEGAVGRLTLDQAEVLNPLGATVLREITQAVAALDAAGAVVIVVSGRGRAFSAGFDLREFAGSAGGADGPATADLGRLMADAVEAADAVTIAAIRGHCIGGGLVLAATCDLRIATDTARFAIPEVDLGIPLAWGGIPRLVREIGPAATRELVMTCRSFDAVEAQRLGLVNRVVPDAELETETEQLVASLLTKAPAVLRTTKRQVHTALEEMVSTDGAWADALLLGAALADPDARAAARRYLDARGRR
jgi:enoyl-CoA hydratase/carnithine racemase